MASLEYQRDGSIVVTNDSGDILIVQPGEQADQDAAALEHIGPQDQPEPTLEEKVKNIAALLVEKGVVTNDEMKDATAIDVAAIAVDIKIG